MQRALPLAIALGLGLAISASAREKVRAWAEGTPVVIVGQITSPPRGAIDEHKMQVGIGPEKTDYTLHFSNATLIGPEGNRIDEDGFDSGQWVRAEGRIMDDPRRIKATRVQVIARDKPQFARTTFWRPGLEYGYVTAVAGSRETFPTIEGPAFVAAPVTLVGKVTDDTGALETTRKIQVSTAGNEWTVNVPHEASVMDSKGEKLSVHEIDDGQWVRVVGWQTDDLRMRAMRVENIGPEEAFRASSFFRAGEPLGYVERVAGSRTEFAPVRVSGTVTEVRRDRGYFMLRDRDGRMYRVYGEGLPVWHGASRRDWGSLRVGDTVTVSGRSVVFD